MWVIIGWLVLIIFTICNYFIYKHSGINIGGALIPWVGGALLIFIIGYWIRFKFKEGAPEREAKKLATEIEEKKQKEDAYFVRFEVRKKIEEMPEYNNWKQKIFRKYGRICEKCNETNDLEIHHKISFDKIIRIFNIQTKEQAFECDALWDISNGSVLCHECHEKMESSIYRKKVTTQG